MTTYGQYYIVNVFMANFRQRRGVHNAGPPHRPGDRGHRLLALGQLLVPGTGGHDDDRGLTSGQARSPGLPASTADSHQRGQHTLVQPHGSLEPGQRLAPGGHIGQWGFPESLTSRPMREEFATTRRQGD